jgi:hypothetical protein
MGSPATFMGVIAPLSDRVGMEPSPDVSPSSDKFNSLNLILWQLTTHIPPHRRVGSSRWLIRLRRIWAFAVEN